jgi:acyl carrier protein
MTAADDYRIRVRQILAEMSPLRPSEARPTDRIMEDLGYDSMAIVELALVLESEFDLEQIDEERAIDLVTVGDVEELVGQMTGAFA